LLLAACSEKPAAPGAAVNAQRSNTPPATAPTGPPMARQLDFAAVIRGATLYQQNCAACHGDAGQGHPQWQRPGSDGKYPAPPLNGTGHAWHHPTAALMQTIKRGTLNRGGSMPGWGDKLSHDDIAAIIAWFQSKWPDEIYAAWQRMDTQSRK
jgi:mono/diheme cytochrome c family protein